MINVSSTSFVLPGVTHPSETEVASGPLPSALPLSFPSLYGHRPPVA
jgi:hypothetical protein